MASKMEDKSSNQSDSDDWTLVSPPHSSSSSPDNEDLSPIDDDSQSDKSSSNSSLEQVCEDGLTEIDLSRASKSPRKKPRIAIVSPTESDERSAKLAEQAFQPLDTTTDDEDVEEEDDEKSAKDSRRSSLTQSELGEYIDLGKKDNDTIPTISNRPNVNNQSTVTLVQQSITDNNQDISNEQSACSLSIKTKMDELSDAATTLQRDKATLRLSQLCRGSFSFSSESKQQLLPDLFIVIILLFVLNYILIALLEFSCHQIRIEKSHNKFPKFLQSLMDEFGKTIPTGQQYEELQSLHSELTECIKRQSPSSYKYYISEDRFKEHSTSKRNKNHKPYRGLVCYGQEAQWRKRFEELKSKNNLDLRQLVLDAKKRITNELLEFYHPSLQFKLILNQIEYLDFIENKRNKKQSEDLVKYLKAENLQLSRLSHPNETGYQKLVISLELENSRLQRENGVLKENLGQKAGTTFIKQSLELEQYERENIILKQFLYQVSQDVSKSLKQFNLHTIHASTILDDQESLNSQLMLTRGYLRRLREKISTTLIENEGLKEELKEVYLLSITDKANLPATNIGTYNARHNNNNSNALMTDNCTRNLMEVKEKNDRLEAELDRMRRNCSENSSFNLQSCSGHHLNGISDTLFQNHHPNLEWKQLGAPETALDKHAKDALSLRNNEDIMDDLMMFLTKFNHQIESNELAVLEHDQHDPHGNSGYLGNDELNAEAKVIPNYIREAIRTGKGCSNKCNIQMQYEENAYAKRPPTPPPAPVYSPDSKNDANTSAPDSIPIDQAHLSADPSPAPTKQNISESVANVDMYPTAARETWFFKRAKQRKQLRGHKVGDFPNGWMAKRATLREKLRKATSYIDDQYIANNYLKCKKNRHPSINNQHQARYDCKNKHGQNNEGQKQKKKHNHKQRITRKSYRDEL